MSNLHSQVYSGLAEKEHEGRGRAGDYMSKLACGANAVSHDQEPIKGEETQRRKC